MAKAVHPLPTVGALFEARYPYVRETVSLFDGDGMAEQLSWKPGTRGEARGPEDAEMVADAEGTIILTVVGVFKPGRFPTRVFFTRRWRDPDGREFGKGNCRMTTVAKFYELSRGYRHYYEMAKQNVLQTAAAE